MKLRNKKTGEIVDLSEGFIRDTYNGEMIQIKPIAISNKEGYVYGSLTELNEEWEDYEEPKEDYMRVIDSFIDYVEKADESFECDESVYKFIEKLKAWKQLRSKGFKFFNNKIIGEYGNVSYRLTYPATTVEEKQLDLLFGGENETH